MSHKKTKPAQHVVRDFDLEEEDLPRRADMIEARNNAPITFVVPPINSLLMDAKSILHYEMQVMKNQAMQMGGRVSVDSESQKARNIVATLVQVQQLEEKMASEDHTELTKAELAAQLRAEAARLEMEGDE